MNQSPAQHDKILSLIPKDRAHCLQEPNGPVNEVLVQVVHLHAQQEALDDPVAGQLVGLETDGGLLGPDPLFDQLAHLIEQLSDG